jgi:iron complex outermembrane receptor protein
MNRLNESEFKMLSFNLSYDLGWAELVSLTSYFDSLNVDHKPSRPQWGVPYFSVLSYIWPGEAFSQEIRLVSTNGGRLTWTAGAYYQDSKNDSSYSVKIPELEDYEYWNGTTSISREQISLYGEVGYWISDRWEATAGLRYFTENARTRILSITEGEVAEDVDAEETFSTPAPRFILSYRPSERVNVYASASKGFRAGGINISNYPSVPASYDPDWLWAYEVGVKAATSRLAVTAALFYNDWQDMQYYFYDNDLWEGYMTNGPSAHSAGIELQLDTQVTRGLRLTFTGSFLESVWDEDFDSGIEYFEAGDRLQYVPDWQLGLLLAYDTPLTAKSVLSIRVDGAYGGDTQWASDDPIHDSTERWNAKIGIVWPTWELGVFVRNITNDVCNIPEGYQHQSVRTYNSPRAVGLELVTKF